MHIKYLIPLILFLYKILFLLPLGEASSFSDYLTFLIIYLLKITLAPFKNLVLFISSKLF